ncbi:MAG: TIGR03862 family flavoprotein [Parvibaculum sp.]
MNEISEKSGARPSVAIIGGGPAGLAAAEQLCEVADIHLFEAMPSLGRKFLLAGKSGLNITHGEAFERFLTRFGTARAQLEPALTRFPPEAIRNWATSLGIETFIGSSGRVFPTAMKASPLLRAWARRLTEKGVTFYTRHRWTGWTGEGALRFDTLEGNVTFCANATVLALGGASWPRLGADGAWTGLLAERGINIAPFRPANCGFDVGWSAHMKERFAGVPVKSVTLSFEGESARGDFVISSHGIEGSLIYAFSAALRDVLERDGKATPELDLAPDRDLARLESTLAATRGRASLANHLRKKAGIDGVKAALLRELAPAEVFNDPLELAHAIKHLTLPLIRPRPIDEAISVTGGIALDEIDENWMLKKLPGIFVAGEMTDWEAPTGGYLITACLATGRAAGDGAASWLRRS